MRTDDRDIRELIRPLRRRWWIIVGVAAIVAAATYMHFKDQPARFSAQTSILVQPSELDRQLGTGSDVITANRTVKNQAQLLMTRSVAEGVAKKLGYQGDPEALLGQVSATALEDSDFVQIQAVSGTPQTAEAIANGFATAFIELRSSQLRDDAVKAQKDIQDRLATLPKSGENKALRDQLNARLQKLRVIESIPSGEAQQVDKAIASRQSIGTDPKKSAIFAGILGLILGGLLVFGIDALDRRMQGTDVESQYDAPVLASLPQDRKAVARSHDSGRLADPLLEPVRSLRTALAVSGNGSGPPRTLLVASALPEEGKTTLTRSLALSYHEAGQRVLVIDCDLRKPSLAAEFEVEEGPGLADVLIGSSTLENAIQRADVELPTDGVRVPGGARAHGEPRTGADIAVLTAGARTSDPAAMLGTHRMREVLKHAAEMYDVVLLDTAPLLAVSDAVSLLGQVDGVLLVARINQTTRDAAKRVRMLLSRVPHVKVLGVVANGAEEADAGHIYPYVNAG